METGNIFKSTRKQGQSRQTDYLLLEQAATTLNQQLTEQNAAQQARIREQQQMTREQRANRRTSRFLSKSCGKWKVTNQHYDNSTSQQEMQKACKRYQQYLGTGYSAKTDFQ